MRTLLWVLVGGLLMGVMAGRAEADFSTPWVEYTKVGDVVTARAWVIAMNAEQTAYGVLVTTDTRQTVLIQATAEKNVVDPATLGRWAMVTARVTARTDAQSVTVQILGVVPIAPPAAAATQKGNP